MKIDFAEPDATPYLATVATTSGTDAVITLVANENDFWVIDWIGWSYGAAPTSGRLEVAIGGVLVFQADIIAGGLGHLDFQRPLYIPILNRAVVITLFDGTTANKLNVRYR